MKKIYKEVLISGGLNKPKPMNAPKMDDELAIGSKRNGKPLFATNQKSNINDGYFVPSD